jgi:catalase
LLTLTPAAFATVSYFGVNSFRFTNKEGLSHFIRYQFIPEEGEQLLTAQQMEQADPNYLMKEIKTHISGHPIRFKMYAQIGEDGDKIEDPSIAWPQSRKKVLLGVVIIKTLSPNTPEEDKSLSFMPNNIPDGIKTADPMLDFRSTAYPISVKERQ